MNRAVFFDRDGVINQSPGPGRYVLSPEEFHLLPGVRETLAAIKAAGWRIVLITNQQCVGKQLLSEKQLHDLHDHMQQSLGEAAAFDRIEYCPHLKGSCLCRKPLPGMVETAAKALNINVLESWLVGDNDSDLACGKAAKIKTLIRFLSEKKPLLPANYTVTTHAALLSIFKENLIINP
jgi:D-glycero-D-manno-heptose 1,7-bisphosphate phosphatase